MTVFHRSEFKSEVVSTPRKTRSVSLIIDELVVAAIEQKIPFGTLLADIDTAFTEHEESLRDLYGLDG